MTQISATTCRGWERGRNYQADGNSGGRGAKTMEGHISAELWAIGGLVLLVIAALGSVLAIRIDGLSKAVEPQHPAILLA